MTTLLDEKVLPVFELGGVGEKWGFPWHQNQNQYKGRGFFVGVLRSWVNKCKEVNGDF